ncbi:hypothetical protein NL676_021895 [Syzygium grande]|nr:hypothetical protein NL676_021895 [Syzygium grande]
MSLWILLTLERTACPRMLSKGDEWGRQVIMGLVPILLHVAILGGLRSGDLLRYLCDVELMIFDNWISYCFSRQLFIYGDVLLFSDRCMNCLSDL